MAEGRAKRVIKTPKRYEDSDEGEEKAAERSAGLLKQEESSRLEVRARARQVQRLSRHCCSNCSVLVPRETQRPRQKPADR